MNKKIVPLKTKGTGWFDVTRYEATKSFDALEWFDQISKRIRISEAIRNGDKASLDHMLPELMGDPLKTTLIGKEILRDIQQSQDQEVVRPLTFEDVTFLRNFIEEGFGASTKPGESVEDMFLRHGWLGEAFLHNQGFLRISLAGTNEEILKGVKAWLSDRRKKIGDVAVSAWADSVQADGISNISKTRSEYSEINKKLAALGDPADPKADEQHRLQLEEYEALLRDLVDLIRSLSGGVSLGKDALSKAFAAWQRSRVLAYFDLDAWSEWKGVKLDEPAMVELLYPEDTKDTSALRNAKKAHLVLFMQGLRVVPALLSATLASNSSY